MNSIFSQHRKILRKTGPRLARGTIFICLVILGATPFVAWAAAQTAGDPAAEFKRMAGELSSARLSGGD